MTLINYDIEELIPQKKPMVMVDKLLFSDEHSTGTAFMVREDNIFCENGVLTEPGIIENIAQTAAAREGYESKVSQEEPGIGYLGAIRNLKILKLPEVGSEIQTEIILVKQVFNASMINGKVFENDTLIAECELKVFIQERE